MRALLLSFVFCGLLALSSAPAFAAIDAAGAAALKKQVEDALLWRLQAAKVAGKGLLLDGAIEVTPKETFYEVLLPKAVVMNEHKRMLDVGTIVVAATPGQPGEWKIDMTLPGQMKLYDRDGTPAADVTIGQQRFSGNWWPEKEMYSQLESSYENIQIIGVGTTPWTGAIRSIKALSDMKENADGTWSGPVTVEAEGIRADVKDKNEGTVTIARLASRSHYDRMDLRQGQALKKGMQEIFNPKSDKSPEKKQAEMAGLMSQSLLYIDGVASTFEINGFNLRLTKTAPEKKTEEVSFDRLLLDNNNSALQNDKARSALKVNVSGLKVSFAPPDFAGLVPNMVNAEINIDNLPVKQILDVVLSAAVTPPAPESDATVKEQRKAAVVAEAKAQLPKVLQDAGTSVTVQNTYSKSTDLEATVDGRLEAAPAAVLGMQGKMSLALKGLDETIQRIQTLSIRPDADPAMMGYVGGLAVLQMIGQASAAADGKSQRNYVFEFTPDGKTLLNGVDIKMVMSGLTANKNQPAPAPAPSTP